MIIIYTDGGSRNNPGEAAYGFAIFEDGKEIAGEGKRLGITTNNVAEYSAVIAAFDYVLMHRELISNSSGIQVLMDSNLIKSQLSGHFRVKHPNMIPLFAKVKAKEKELGVSISYKHIPREQNKRADQLVNLALDGLI